MRGGLKERLFDNLIGNAGLSKLVYHRGSLSKVYNCRRPANEAFLYGWLANRIGDR